MISVSASRICSLSLVRKRNMKRECLKFVSEVDMGSRRTSAIFNARGQTEIANGLDVNVVCTSYVPRPIYIYRNWTAVVTSWANETFADGRLSAKESGYVRNSLRNLKVDMSGNGHDFSELEIYRTACCLRWVTASNSAYEPTLLPSYQLIFTIRLDFFAESLQECWSPSSYRIRITLKWPHQEARQTSGSDHRSKSSSVMEGQKDVVGLFASLDAALS